MLEYEITASVIWKLGFKSAFVMINIQFSKLNGAPTSNTHTDNCSTNMLFIYALVFCEKFSTDSFLNCGLQTDAIDLITHFKEQCSNCIGMQYNADAFSQQHSIQKLFINWIFDNMKFTSDHLSTISTNKNNISNTFSRLIPNGCLNFSARVYEKTKFSY